jgi:two-component system, OmpR family, sensor histidine kinase CpxA
MRKLYWKIFIWFWIAMCFTIFITALLSSQVTRHSSSDSDEHAFISVISSAALTMVDSGNREQFDTWNQYLRTNYNIQLAILPLKHHEKIEIAEEFQPINKQLNKLGRSHIKPPFLISPPLVSNSGDQYRLVAKFPPEVFEAYKFNRGNIIVRFSLAFIFGGFVCYLLSLYLSRPIRILQRAARRLGRGNLSTRVSAKLTSRNDEIGQLSTEFNDMATRLESLILSRQQLLQDISHELRSPLARLSVALELAKDKAPQVTKELERIGKESEKLNELIQQILTLASLTNEDPRMAFNEFDLTKMIRSIIDDANFEAQHLPSTITFDCPSSCNINANFSLIQSAIENVVRNALNYSEKDQPLKLSLALKEKNINITIEDTGPGIAEDMLPHIFEPFFRTDDSRTSSTGGFGLGLAIAKKAILLHRGTIKAYNVPTGGLGVNIFLPQQ